MRAVTCYIDDDGALFMRPSPGTIMRKVKRYVAYDGKAFESPDACRAYEAQPAKAPCGACRGTGRI